MRHVARAHLRLEVEQTGVALVIQGRVVYLHHGRDVVRSLGGQVAQLAVEARHGEEVRNAPAGQLAPMMISHYLAIKEAQEL